MMLVLALDIATKTGWARGRIGEMPQAGSIKFGRMSRDQNVVFGAAIQWASELLAPQPRPDIVVIEALLPHGAAQGQTQKLTRDRLAGLHGAIRGVCSLRGIKDIRDADVLDVRSHFIGDRRLKRDAAKRAVIAQCIRLGWIPEDDNAADALACWSYGCALIDPKTALQLAPLFNNCLVL